MGGWNLTIRPTRFARVFVAVVMGALVVLILVGIMQGSTLLGLLPALLFVAFAVGVAWITAGCDDSRVWYGWRSADRSSLISGDVSSRRSRGVDYGGLSLFDATGRRVLFVPRGLFADRDFRELVAAIGLPPRQA
jgi:hypothetical protein